jgi:response regulator RpfG family c-di-GMP phosphodiesterase
MIKYNNKISDSFNFLKIKKIVKCNNKNNNLNKKQFKYEEKDGAWTASTSTKTASRKKKTVSLIQTYPRVPSDLLIVVVKELQIFVDLRDELDGRWAPPSEALLPLLVLVVPVQLRGRPAGVRSAALLHGIGLVPEIDDYLKLPGSRPGVP